MPEFVRSGRTCPPLLLRSAEMVLRFRRAPNRAKVGPVGRTLGLPLHVDPLWCYRRKNRGNARIVGIVQGMSFKSR